jgi:Glycosyl transferase family 2/N-terminal domain of galactosyltransferase
VTTTQQPMISVVVPAYNRSALLARTLETLRRQRLPAADFEVIVADDGSSDDTEQVARSFADRLRLRYWFQEDQGFRVAAARNAGARLASAPLLAFLDCGTLAGPDFVGGHLAAHAARPVGAAAGTGSGGTGSGGTGSGGTGSGGTGTGGTGTGGTGTGGTGTGRAVLGYCFGYRPNDEMPVLATALDELEPAEVVRRYGDDPAFQDVRHRAFADVGFDLGRLSVPWIHFWAMNCSVGAGPFWEAGGFDEDFRTWGGEDMELGYRLFHRGLRYQVSREAWTIEMPHERRLKANRQSNKRNLLRILHKHCEPVTELVCSAELRDAALTAEPDHAALRAWTWDAAGLDVRAEIEKAAQDVPAGASIAIIGCGAAIPASLPPCILVDFDRRLLARALASDRHTGYQLIGIRTPLRAGSVDAVIITSRLSGLWDRWGGQVLAEAHRIGRQVLGPPPPAGTLA